MFPESLADGDFFSSHWSVVIGISLAFFVAQVVLTLRFYVLTRRQERILAELCRDLEQGGDGRGRAEALPPRFTWLDWVISVFPAGTDAPRGDYTREDVLQELDTRIASNSDYLLLQRMGVMAPLLGVVLTVVGFFWFEVNAFEEQSLQSILLAVTPLISGVGAGAVLALINQGLLHFAGRHVESLRMSARSWFDAAIWRHVNSDQPAATAKAVSALEHFAGALANVASQHNASAHRIEQSTASMKDAASQFRAVVQSFSGEIKGAPEALAEVRSSTAAAARALEELIHVGSRAVANLDVSVAAFRTTLDRDFAVAAKLHYRSSQLLAESVEQIGESTQQLKSGSDEMKRTAEASDAAFQTMDESIRNHMVPGNRQFYDAVEALTGQTADLSQAIGQLSSNADAMAAKFDRAAGGLAPSVANFCDAIDHHFGPAVVQHSQQVQSVGRSMQHLRETAESMSEGTTALNAMLDGSSRCVSQFAAAHETLARMAKDLADAEKNLQRTMESDAVASQRTMRDAASSFAKSAAQLSNFIEQGLSPATQQLSTLHQTLAGVATAVDSIKDFSRAREDIDRLTDTLSRAAEISDAISALPEQIREVLEQNAGHAALTNSHIGLRRWLARRPR